MRYSFIVIVFIFNTFTLSAQDTSILTDNTFTLSAQDTSILNEKLSYGLSTYFTVSSPDRHGLGAEMYAAYRIKPNSFLQSNLGYKRYSYSYPSQKRIMEDIHLRLALKQSLNQAKEIKLALGYEPAFIINATNINLGFTDSIPTHYFAKDLNNRLSHSLYIGLEFQSKLNGSIEVGYTHTLNKGTVLSVNNGITNTYFDAIPNHLKIGYNFKFNTNANVPYDVLEARTTLQRLTKDTLYFISRGCDEDYTFDQLDSLLNKNYSYSAYRLLKDDEIEHISTQANVVHFAIIGQHYSSTADPISNGIYLLDKDLKNTEFPYPYHTANPKNSNGLSYCFGGLYNTGALINSFNHRLERKHKEL
jgi:hypothetical protein